MMVVLPSWGYWVALAGLWLTPCAAMAAQTATFNDFPGLSASLDIPEGACPSVIPLTIQAERAEDVRHGSRALDKVMAWAQINTQLSCPQANAIQVTGLVGGVSAYSGVAQRAFQWALVEAKGGKPPAAVSSAVALCDRLGAHPDDPERVTRGVTDKSLNASKLVLACEAATKADPEVPRLRFQLARGYLRVGRLEDAVEQLLNAAEADHGGAMAYLADIHLNGGPGIEVDPVLARTLYGKAAAAGFEPAAKILLEFEDKTDDHAAAEAAEKAGAGSVALAGSGSPKPYVVAGVVDNILNRRFDQIEYNESWVKEYLYNMADNIAAICESHFTKQELGVLKMRANEDLFGMQQASVGANLMSTLVLMANMKKGWGAIAAQERSPYDDPFEAGMKDTEALFSRHLCGTPELKRFSENLSAYANNLEAPLPGFRELSNACLMHTPPSKYKPADFCMCFAASLSQARVSQANRRALQQDFKSAAIKLMDISRNKPYFQGCRTGI